MCMPAKHHSYEKNQRNHDVRNVSPWIPYRRHVKLHSALAMPNECPRVWNTKHKRRQSSQVINIAQNWRYFFGKIETYFTLIRNTKTKTIVVAFHHKQYGDGCIEFHKNSIILSENTTIFPPFFLAYINKLFSYNLIHVSISYLF